MKNLKNYIEDTQNSTVEIKRTAAFDRTAKELGDFISSLPLSSEQNNELVKLIIRQIQEAEQGAFNHGVCIGSGISKEFNQDTEKICFLTQ